LFSIAIQWRTLVVIWSIDTLNIFRFNKINETNNLAYLIKSDDPDWIPDKQPELLKTVWDHITNQYHAEIERTRPRNVKLDTIKQVSKMQIDKYIIRAALLCYSLEPDKDSMLTLSKYGYFMDKSKGKTYHDRVVQCQEVNRRLATIDAKIKILSRDIEELKTDEKEIITFDEIVLIASKRNGIRIDPMTTSVRQWIAIENDSI